MPLTQDLDLIASGTFAAENIEQQLDKLAAEIQTLRELIARTPQLPVGTALTDPTLPEPRTGVANQLLERDDFSLNRRGFPKGRESDSRCWLGWRPASDGQTLYDGFAHARC
jgi:hypothetical protein